MKINDNTRLITKVLIIMALFYVAIMFIWNYTNTSHKPSNKFWDWKKEGYQLDPLYDRGRDK